jgi:hypothetical protein
MDQPHPRRGRMKDFKKMGRTEQIREANTKKRWCLLFLKSNQNDKTANRSRVAQQFADFWYDDERNMITLNGDCYLGWFTRDEHSTSETPHTSKEMVTKIRVIKRSSYNSYFDNLLEVETKDGKLYYVYSNSVSARFRSMIAAYRKLSTLNPEPGFYLEPEFKGSIYL